MKKAAREKMARIFDEWAKRYAEEPDEYSEILDEDGNPVGDYGECSAEYFDEIAKELGIKIEIT